MKIILAGGRGHVGAVLRRSMARDHELVVLSRISTPLGNAARVVTWDGETMGDWTEELDGADVVINLAGRSVDCRYHARNLAQMLESRLKSTTAIGRAIALARRPPRVWLQASTATIYAHRHEAPNDELTGRIGGSEPGAPQKWNASVAIALAWEEALAMAATPFTRKVALRSAMTMSRDHGSVFDVLARLARRGLGGTIGTGQQYVSWIHEDDFVDAIRFIIEHDELSGAVNLAAPEPLRNRDFMTALRKATGRGWGLPTPRAILEIGCWLLRTESELVLKSRRVVPRRLLEAGFSFRHPSWPEAALDLAKGTAPSSANGLPTKKHQPAPA